MTFYRYEAENTSYAKDHTGEYISSPLLLVNLKLVEYDMVKETPKGYWIGWKDYRGKYKFVLKTSKKKWAYLTKEEAMVNFIKRTESRISILKNQLEFSIQALQAAKNIGDMN